MASNGAAQKAPVAWLCVHYRASASEPFQQTDHAIPICARESFYFGRSPSCKFSSPDPTVSNRHLRFHCILFDEHSEEGHDVPPLVYVEDLSTNGTYLTRSQSAGQVHLASEQRLSRRDGSILLADNDRLRISPTLALLFQYESTVTISGDGLSSSQRREAELFADRFTITNQLLGSGGYGAVFAAVHKRTGRQLACKAVQILDLKRNKPNRPLNDITNTSTGSPGRRRKEQDDYRDMLLKSNQFREFDILKELDHPNVIHLEKVFWSTKNIFIFQELVTGGDLFSYIEFKGNRVPDAESAVIVYQILKGVDYLHDRNIVHRDLKPDNILISSTKEPFRVIITDFGNCICLTEQDQSQAAKRRMFSEVGTLEYAAPEVNRKNPLVGREIGYSKAVDLWSIGAITTALLTGDVIFTDRINPLIRTEPRRVILQLSSTCDLKVLDDPNSNWRKVGKRPKDFIKKLLVLDEVKRLTVKQALNDEWFINKHYAAELASVYKKVVDGWVPSISKFRVIEALDHHRLRPEAGQPTNDLAPQSRFFQVPFPQGQLFASKPTIAQAGLNNLPPLSTITEEEVPQPQPSTPRHFLPQTPSAPNAKKAGRFSHSQHDAVDDSFSQLEILDAYPNQSEVFTDTMMTVPGASPAQPSTSLAVDDIIDESMDVRSSPPRADGEFFDEEEVMADVQFVAETPQRKRLFNLGDGSQEDLSAPAYSGWQDGHFKRTKMY